MKQRLLILVLGLTTVAAVAFESGRRSERSVQHEVTFPEPAPTQPQPPSLSIPAANILAYLPFEEARSSLKSASPAHLEQWVREIRSIKARPTRWAAVSGFFKSLIQIDPDRALEVILSLDAEHKMIAMQAIRTSAPPRALPQVVKLLSTFPEEEIAGCSYNYLRDAISEWSTVDPDAVARFLDTQDQNKMVEYFGNLVSNWAAYDPGAAKVWAEKKITERRIFSNDERHTDDWHQWDGMPGELMQAWLEGTMIADRERGHEYVLAHADRLNNDWALFNVADKVYCDSPEAARDFIQRLPVSLRAGALRGIAYLAERTVYGDAEDQTRSPAAIANWMVENFPKEWDHGAEQLISEWRYKDTDELFAWICELPLAARDIAVDNYKPYLAEDRMQKEFASVMRVPVNEVRDRLLENMMRKTNSLQARLIELVQTAELSPEQRQHLVSLLPEEIATYSEPEE